MASMSWTRSGSSTTRLPTGNGSCRRRARRNCTHPRCGGPRMAASPTRRRSACPHEGRDGRRARGIEPPRRSRLSRAPRRIAKRTALTSRSRTSVLAPSPSSRRAISCCKASISSASSRGPNLRDSRATCGSMIPCSAWVVPESELLLRRFFGGALLHGRRASGIPSLRPAVAQRSRASPRDTRAASRRCHRTTA